MSILQKRYLYPFLLLFFPIIIDCLNGYLKGASGEGESMVGILYRGAVVIYALPYLLKNIFSKYIFFILVISFISFSYHIIMGYFLISSISNLIKVLYIFCVLSILLKNKYFDNIWTILNCAIGYGLAAALVLILSYFLGFGYNAYLEDSFGTKGFFIAMNDVGLTILLLNALSCFCFLKTKKVLYLIATLIMSIGTVFVGSMACYFGTGAIMLCFFFNIVFNNTKDYRSSFKQKIIVIFIFSIGLIESISFIVNSILSDSYLSKKYSDIIGIFMEMSGRDYLIEASFETFEKFSLFDWLLGIGVQFSISIQYILGLNGPKGVEVDPLDLIGTYGLLFSILILIFPLNILCKTIKSYLKNKDLLSYWLTIGLSLYVLHAIYGGHAYTSPLVSSYLAVYIYLYVKRQNLTTI
ncbi:hypothetical protein [Dysgonomonas sp. Marseille-Q5470]|uniref:hypothetical protein n=1 Tax=Dysgonomonas sp. Marseille-Q5470 TaxID=3039494 RepID=UPI0024BCE0D1|nr:hypothetical protein [Dysgonomonas sp. Marseille-Q5470]